jgi:acetyltransferase-like isoleucine patch superfamily enzyme
MFNGEPYAHLSRDLQIFREATAALLKTFNDNSPSGPDERGRQFEPVLKPDPSRRRFSAISSQIQNRMGRDAFVEVPFKCEYGSNIRLGDNVYIEGGCHIADPREVFIDNGTQIGAGVKIIGKVIPLDPHIRCGGLLSPQAEGKARGVEIYIGKNVYIGSNTVIQPDESVDKRLEIGDYAYIKPGSVVSKVFHSSSLWRVLEMAQLTLQTGRPTLCCLRPTTRKLRYHFWNPLPNSLEH